MNEAAASSRLRRVVKHRVFLPVVFFIVFIGIFTFSSQFTVHPPVIDGIAPSVGNPGSVMVISGRNFGDDRQGGEVTIAGARLTSNSYREWSDERISVRVPDNVGSGQVFVTTRAGTSNGVLFTNSQHIPVILSGPLKPGFPHISSVSPDAGSVGTLVTISGLNFGFERGSGKIYFTATGTSDESRQAETDVLSYSIADSEEDFDCESWTDQEIRVYVPDGTASGNLRVRTDRGLSNTVYFEVTGVPGTKLFTDSRGYQISYRVEIRNVEAEEYNSLDIWFPGIYRGLRQRDVEVLHEPEPLWKDVRGFQRYRFENLTSGQNIDIQATAWFERYAVETVVNVSKVTESYNTDRLLYKTYTAPDRIVPSDNEEVRRLAVSAAGREKNPYIKARRVYDYLLKNLVFTRTPESRDPLRNLKAGEGDSYAFSVLFSAFLRSLDVPARPIAGYLVYGDKIAVKHYWAEFYLEKYGWVPVDPALGAGARYGNFPNSASFDPPTYYFGNQDNRHIAFSRGVSEIKPAGAGNNFTYRERLYTLQTIFEEYTGISSYDAYYRDISIVEWW